SPGVRAMPAKPKSIDEYLERISADKRAALEKLRKIIQAAAPNAEEGITYGIAAFRLNGKWLVGFGASANHCSFYPMNGTTVAASAEGFEGYETSKGATGFRPDKPLPAALVRKLVKARVAENGG